MINKTIYILVLATLFLACKNSEKLSANSADKPLTRAEAEKRGLFIDGMRQKMIGNYGAAEGMFLEVLKRDEKNAASYYELSRIYDSSSSILKALESAKAAYNLDEDNVWYQKQLASLYRKNGYYKESLEMLEEIAAKDPKNLDYLIAIAEVSFLANDMDRSIKALDAIIDNIGPNPEIVTRKIQMLLEAEKYKEAEKSINKYIESDPTNPGLYEVKAEMYKYTGELNKQNATYEKLAELDPSNSKAQIAMADKYAKEGNEEEMMKALFKVYGDPNVNIDNKVQLLLALYEESNADKSKRKTAYQLLDTMVVVHPEEAKTYSMYGDFLLRDEKYVEAQKSFHKASELDPSRFPIWNQLLLLDIQLTDENAMVKDGEKAIELFPTQPIAYLVAGIGSVRKKDYEEAIDHLNMGKNLIIGKEELKYEFYVNLGEAYYSLKEYDDAFRNYQSAVDIDGSNPYLLNNYAYYLSLQKRDIDNAAEMAKKANEIQKNQNSFEDTYAYILFIQKKYDLANEWIQKALNNGGDASGTILEHAGDIAFFLNQTDKALEYWKSADGKEGASDYLKKKIETKTYVEK